jgi:SAM-dependent methyltransferase
MTLDYDEFLRPACSRTNLDIFLVRRSILEALKDRQPSFDGIVLDIGCGHAPYKSIIVTPPSRAKMYVGLDLSGGNYYAKPDLIWDGETIPLRDNTIDSAIATEVFEHCPVPEKIMREAVRVLKPGASLFFTVPFLWPLHEVPHDEYRYTPFALRRHLLNAGFARITLAALGGWDRSLAQMLGLWVRRRPMGERQRALLSTILLPVVAFLDKRDTCPKEFRDSTMITGIAGVAQKIG